MDVQDCPEWDDLRNDERVIALANQSHVMREHGLTEIEPLNTQEGSIKTIPAAICRKGEKQ
jgi:hypothetical protein